MSWPSTITTYTNPTPTNFLNSPSHSSIETAQNTSLTELQTYIGTTTSSALGTLIGAVMNPNSNGGGHVQTANKGGTGQTTYTTGDMLVATSQSVLSKLAVGLDNQVLTANSSVAGGIQWTNVTQFSNLIGSSQVSSTIGNNTTAETSVFSVTIPASTLGSASAIRTTVYVGELTSGGATSSVLINANFGGKTVASVVLANATPQYSSNAKGKLEFTIMSRGSITSQRNYLMLDAKPNISGQAFDGVAYGSIAGWWNYASSVNSIDGGAPQTLGMTVQFPNSGVGTKFTYDGYLIEKIK